MSICTTHFLSRLHLRGESDWGARHRNDVLFPWENEEDFGRRFLIFFSSICGGVGVIAFYGLAYSGIHEIREEKCFLRKNRQKRIGPKSPNFLHSIQTYLSIHYFNYSEKYHWATLPSTTKIATWYEWILVNYSKKEETFPRIVQALCSSQWPRQRVKAWSVCPHITVKRTDRAIFRKWSKRQNYTTKKNAVD